MLRAGTDRVASIASGLRDRFGLTLTTERRPMEALIVDEIARDASLVLLAHAGRDAMGAAIASRAAVAHPLDPLIGVTPCLAFALPGCSRRGTLASAPPEKGS